MGSVIYSLVLGVHQGSNGWFFRHVSGMLPAHDWEWALFYVRGGYPNSSKSRTTMAEILKPTVTWDDIGRHSHSQSSTQKTFQQDLPLLKHLPEMLERMSHCARINDE